MAARDLFDFGVAVVNVLDDTSRRSWEEDLWKALDTMPEFKVSGRHTQRVLGGFGAYGNPSSFHDPTIRLFRKKFKRLAARPLFREYVQLRFNEYTDVRLETLFDRVCVRSESFRRPNAETWHRDIYDAGKYKLRELPSTLPDGTQDVLIGGWCNLDDRTQRFVGLLGTHTETDAAGGGFSTYTKEQIREFRFNERLAQQGGKRFGSTIQCDASGEILVPPGNAVFFLQRLVHSVKSGPQPDTAALRIFHGFRITREEASLFDHEGILANGAVPRIPSGQMPAMFSQNHFAAFANPNEDHWRTWGMTTFVNAALFARRLENGTVYYTPGSRHDMNKAANRGRYMPSLAEMGLWSERFEYTTEERDALYPQRLFA